MTNPSWKNRDSRRVDSFVGRNEALKRFDALSEPPARMVTICGPPGVGKTTLTRKLQSERLRDRFGDDVYFCSLEDARDADDIVARIADAIGVTLDARTSDEEAAERVAQQLESTPTALILDNFEHVVDAGRSLLCDWIDRLTDSLVVVTSRQPVGMSEEAILDLEPLSVDEAVELYRQSAARSRSAGLDIDDADITTLVERLDCLPLAIELAAAQLPILGPGDLLDRWDHLFDMLRRPSEGLAAGDSPLSVAIEGSWRLLSDQEQATLVQLTIFQEEFSLEAAEAVVDIDDAGPTAVPALIRKLHDKSLLRVADQTPRGPSFALYVSVREYVRQQQSPQLPERTRLRFVGYFRDFVDHYHRECREAETRSRLEAFFEEESNVRAAFEHALDCAPLQAAEIGWGLVRLSLFFRPLQSADALVEQARRALDSVEESPQRRRAEAMLCLTRAVPIQWGAPDPDDMGWEVLQRGIALTDTDRSADLRADLRMAQNAVDSPNPEENDYEHRKQFLDDAVASAKRARNNRLLCAARRTLGAFHLSHREFRLAQREIKRSLALGRKHDLINAVFSARIYLGQMARMHGHLEEAAMHMEKGLADVDELGNRPLAAVGTYMFGDVLVLLGELDRAETILDDVEERIRHLDFVFYLPPLLVSQGLLALKRGQFDDAAERFHEAFEIGPSQALQTHPFEVHCMAALLEYWRGRESRAEEHRRKAKEIADAYEQKVGSQPLELLDAFRKAASAKHESEGGSDGRARDLLDQARAIVDDFRRRTSQEDDASGERVRRSSQRIALMTDWAVDRVRDALPDESLGGETDALLVAPEAAWFRTPEADETVDLSRRGAIRRILDELADLRASAPGTARDVYELLEAGWPDEDILPESGKSRVYTAINGLRELGLDGILITSDEGYLLDPDLPLRRPDEPPAD